MPTIMMLLVASLMTVIAVIGLADALAHLLGWAMRSLRTAVKVRADRPLVGVARRGRVAV
jgi:hypothetical protein